MDITASGPAGAWAAGLAFWAGESRGGRPTNMAAATRGSNKSFFTANLPGKLRGDGVPGKADGRELKTACKTEGTAAIPPPPAGSFAQNGAGCQGRPSWSVHSV